MNTAASSSNIPVPVTSKKKSSATMSGDQRTVVAGNSSLYVKLNVGGSLHYTTIGTLTKKDNMLRAMFSGRMEVLTDSDGWILIDRCGKHFGTILNFLRDDSVVLPDSGKDVADLLAEAKFYCIPELVEACEAALQRREKTKELERICYVPLITNREEEAALIASTRKPIVKLFVNRHNNKYSYTSTSDENLLKNIEQFDKLCQRFHGRIFFIKDVIGTNEICCWTFYGHGKKIAEVSCTSIVYATDKKHTKVDFPESRIYEETLNVLLYETRTGPEWDLMQVTSNRAPLPLNYNSDDEDEVGATASPLTTAFSSLSTVPTSTVGASASGSSATFGPRRPTSTPSSGVAKFRSGKHSN